MGKSRKRRKTRDDADDPEYKPSRSRRRTQSTPEDEPSKEKEDTYQPKYWAEGTAVQSTEKKDQEQNEPSYALCHYLPDWYKKKIEESQNK